MEGGGDGDRFPDRGVWRKMVGQNCVRAKSQSVRIEIESAIDSEKLQ